MTLDEAIKHCEEVVEESDKLSIRYDMASRHYRNYNEVFESMYAKRSLECFECAEEHRQLAEWLKELKKLREIPDKLVPKYHDGIRDEYDRGANEMLEEVIDTIRKYMEEVKADADNN